VVSSFPDKDLTAEIRLSPNDRFVYVSDRGANTMTIFLQNPRTGTLSIVQHVSAGGKFPVIRGQVIRGQTGLAICGGKWKAVADFLSVLYPAVLPNSRLATKVDD